jgi:hypothetical protein
MQHMTGENDACPGQQSLTRAARITATGQRVAIIYAGW